MHTEGEPLRVVVDGYPIIEGKTILDKRTYVKQHYDNLRELIINEPRGHADMYGCLVVEPSNSEAEFGVIFMHNEGYSTMCGHATIAISKLAVLLNWVRSESNSLVDFKIEAPCGLLECFVEIDAEGLPIRSFFNNVPSFCLDLDESVDVPGLGKVTYDLSYGGAFYALVEASQLNMELGPNNVSEIIQCGKAIKKAIVEAGTNVSHPTEPDLSFLYGVIFTGPTTSQGVHSRNVCVFADGEVDRSPTGSGVSARLAAMFQKGEIGLEESVIIESIVGTQFTGKIVSEAQEGDLKAIVPQVGGSSFITGKHEFMLEENDNLPNGFVLR